MDTLHSVMTGRTWKDFGKHQYCELHTLLYPKNPTGFGNVDTGVIIWVTENTILGLYCVILLDLNITRIFSALYVIDLVRFRQLAAGDRLRGQYQVINSTCLTF